MGTASRRRYQEPLFRAEAAFACARALYEIKLNKKVYFYLQIRAIRQGGFQILVVEDFAEAGRKSSSTFQRPRAGG